MNNNTFLWPLVSQFPPLSPTFDIKMSEQTVLPQVTQHIIIKLLICEGIKPDEIVWGDLLEGNPSVLY